MIWLSENRPSIVKSMPVDHKVTDVAKEAGKQWNKLTAAKKKKYVTWRLDKQLSAASYVYKKHLY